MSRVLWIADGGATTGFARVTHEIGERLVTNYGHEIHVIACNYKGDPYPSFANRTPLALYVPNIYERDDTYGRSRFLILYDDLKPDAIVIVNDPQVAEAHLFRNKWDPQGLLVKSGTPIILYQPVDGYDLPKRYDLLGQFTNRVAMSKFGQEAMPDAKLCYHGVDTDDFWPVSSEHPIITSGGVECRTKADCKEAIGLPRDAFVVGRVDTNSGRKDFPATWKAMLPVMRRNSDVIAYFHCKPRNVRNGIDMTAMFSRDPDTQSRFYVPDPNYDPVHGYSQQDLNAVYNAFDVFVSTSRGEGFGLTIAEALACGVPVIAQNVSSIPEVVGPGGELIDPERAITVPFGHDQMLANIGAFTEAIEHAYQSRGWRREKGKAGRDHVTSSFRWDDAADAFHDYITGLSAGVEVDTHGKPEAAPV
jgi:glycosyltransferase involved in cell wall biosynthesis